MSCQIGNGLLREWMPVAHRDYHTCVEFAAQHGFQRFGLAARELQNRRFASDLGVVMRHMACAAHRDDLGQRLPRNLSEGKVDDIRIAKKVVEKRLDRLERVRSAELKQHYPDLRLRHRPKALSLHYWDGS